jgi:hypothetical protein
MRRLSIFALALALAGCGGEPSTSVQPETLSMTDPPPADHDESLQETDVMLLDIDGERFELFAGICNTYDDGTFRFALAEGRLDTNARTTATIERFDTGAGFKVVVALEEQQDEGGDVSWYASGDIAADQMSVSVFGPTITGTARFSPSGDDGLSPRSVDGRFSLSCS